MAPQIPGPHPGRENVHALFDQARFPQTDINWGAAFYESAVLATRLLNSPQALHYDYCFYFGTSKPANLPVDVSPLDGVDRLPVQYSCNKGIGELDRSDIVAVNRQRLLLAERISFKVVSWKDKDNPVRCYALKPVNGINGRGSLIWIHVDGYNKMLEPDLKPEDKARFVLAMACNLLHEAAHAAHNHGFGVKREDFCENSLVAEAGLELESRIFGAKPNVPIGKPEFSSFGALRTAEAGYDMNALCRNAFQHPKVGVVYEMDNEFVMKLLDDDFWEGEYLEHGARSLVPEIIALICQGRRIPGNARAHKGIPQSIMDLFRDGGPSYAQKKYFASANPGRELRVAPTEDYRIRSRRRPAE